MKIAIELPLHDWERILQRADSPVRIAMDGDIDVLRRFRSLIDEAKAKAKAKAKGTDTMTNENETNANENAIEITKPLNWWRALVQCAKKCFIEHSRSPAGMEHDSEIIHGVESVVDSYGNAHGKIEVSIERTPDQWETILHWAKIAREDVASSYDCDVIIEFEDLIAGNANDSNVSNEGESETNPSPKRYQIIGCREEHAFNVAIINNELHVVGDRGNRISSKVAIVLKKLIDKAPDWTPVLNLVALDENGNRIKGSDPWGSSILHRWEWGLVKQVNLDDFVESLKHLIIALERD